MSHKSVSFKIVKGETWASCMTAFPHSLCSASASQHHVWGTGLCVHLVGGPKFARFGDAEGVGHSPWGHSWWWVEGWWKCAAAGHFWQREGYSVPSFILSRREPWPNSVALQIVVTGLTVWWCWHHSSIWGTITAWPQCPRTWSAAEAHLRNGRNCGIRLEPTSALATRRK